MLFGHDTEVALSAATALVNTAQPEIDHLSSRAELLAFVQEWGRAGRLDGTARELEEVRALRTRLRQVWELDTPGVVELLNQLLRDGDARPQLVKHDDWDYHVHASAADAPLHHRMAVEAAMGLTDLVRLQQLDRLRICAAETCSDVLVDLSKNQSRRFCGVTCANRTNVAAYRARRAQPS